MKEKVEINRRAIGQRIRQEREKLGLSREELAEITGFSEYYLGQLERGERQMSLPALITIAKSLHISLDYLVWGTARKVSAGYVCEGGESYIDHRSRDWDEIKNILTRCSAEELKLFKKIAKVILPYLKGNN